MRPTNHPIITEGRGFKSHLRLGFFRVPSGFRPQFNFKYIILTFACLLASETIFLIKIKLSITWKGIQPGLRILARYFLTGIRFLARPNGPKNSCNRYHFTHPGPKKERNHAHRLHLSKLSHGNLRFAPVLNEIEHVIATIFQPCGRGEISA